MWEEARRLEPGFSTADASQPSIAFHDGVVILEYTDSREQHVRVKFADAVGMNWEQIDSNGPEDRDDSVYEITPSGWLHRYAADGVHTEVEKLHHYRLCFNAIGVLDVLAASMTVESTE